MTDDTPPTTDEQHDDQPPAEVREGLRDATTPLATTDPTADREDLAPLGDRLAAADVVGLGEATHGTREFFQLKHRVIAHLVADHGVRAVAMEANLPEAMALHDYVVHGEGNARDALADVYFWTWQAESVLAMVEWLRAFNADRPLADRVVLYGIDGQYTHGAVERLRDHLATVDPDLLAEIELDLERVDDDAEPPHQAEDLSERVAAGERLLPRLRNHLDDHREPHAEAAGGRGLERLERSVTIIEQALDYAALMDDADGDPDDVAVERLITQRDRTMAENVAWVRDHTDADTLVLWAHDAHVNRVEQAHPHKDPTAPSLGRHLADHHGTDYYALGFSFARGTFQAMSEADDGEYMLREQHVDGPVPGTMDAALDDLDEALAFVDLRAARDDERTADWLARPQRQFRAGGTYDVEDPGEQLIEYVYADAFDGLCFVAETTRARPLEQVDATPDDDG